MGRKPIGAEERTEMRGRILNVALQAVEEHGLHKLTMRDVARRAAMSPMSLYTYFAAKADLIVGLGERGTELLEDIIRDAASIVSAQERLVALGDAYVAFAVENPRLYEIVFVDIPAELVPRETADQFRRRATAALHPLLATVGEIMGHEHAPDVVMYRALMLMCSLHGYVMLRESGRIEGLGASPARLQDTFRQHLAKLLSD